MHKKDTTGTANIVLKYRNTLHHTTSHLQLTCHTKSHDYSYYIIFHDARNNKGLRLQLQQSFHDNTGTLQQRASHCTKLQCTATFLQPFRVMITITTLSLMDHERSHPHTTTLQHTATHPEHYRHTATEHVTLQNTATRLQLLHYL